MRRSAWIAGLALAVLGLALAAPAGAQERDTGKLLSEGRKAYEDGDYAHAREVLWDYLDATAGLTGAARMPQAEALWYIALMEPDAAVAAQNYQTIVDEYASSSLADEALMRLGQYALVEGRTDRARDVFQRLAKDYPFSKYQPEVPMWVGRAYMVDGDYDAAEEAFLNGYTRVRSGDLPRSLSGRNREAMEAEYVYWLASANRSAGRDDTANQYWTQLTMDYADSPQAAEAREILSGAGEAEGEEVALANPAGESPDQSLAEEAPAEETPPDEGPAETAPTEEAPVAENPPSGEGAGRVENPAPETPAPEKPSAEKPKYVPIQPRPAAGSEGPPAAEPPREEPRREVARQEPATPRPAPRAEDRVAEGPPRKPPAGADQVYLEVGAFSDAQRAADLAKRLRAIGFEPDLDIGLVDGKGYYRVRLGPYRVPKDADRLTDDRGKLDKAGFASITMPARE